MDIDECIDELPLNRTVRPWFKDGTFETQNRALANKISSTCHGLWNSSGRCVKCKGIEYFVIIYYDGMEIWTKNFKER